MSLAARQIASLDRKVRAKGQTVRLQRIGQRDPDNFITFRAFVRGYAPSELSGGIEQGDSEVTISPSALVQAGITDPIENGDRIWISGYPRAVRFCNPVLTDDVVVRWDTWVKGGV
jgi:hypothetical protein